MVPETPSEEGRDFFTRSVDDPLRIFFPYPLGETLSVEDISE
jgi:hypothetical protein